MFFFSRLLGVLNLILTVNTTGVASPQKFLKVNAFHRHNPEVSQGKCNNLNFSGFDTYFLWESYVLLNKTREQVLN